MSHASRLCLDSRVLVLQSLTQSILPSFDNIQELSKFEGITHEKTTGRLYASMSMIRYGEIYIKGCMCAHA